MRSSASEPSSRQSVYAALIGNLLVAITKGIAAAITGSSAMLSETVHSFVDCGNEMLLLYGQKQAARPADSVHPFGYGRELYFWSFVVALLVFTLGAGVAIYEGVQHIRNPHPISDPTVNYVVLAFAFLFEGASWVISIRQFRAANRDRNFYEAFRRSKDPPSFMVLFEDSAALLGIAIAAAGTFVSSTLHMPVFDGIASVLIGLILAAVALLLGRESKSLLIGEPGDRDFTDSICTISSQVRGVVGANDVLTSYLSPDQVVVSLSIEFEDTLRVPELEEIVKEIERRVRAKHPEVMSIFVKPQTPQSFSETDGARVHGDEV
jgi:cation diffusion facilitator family transporter